jgi:23S rRNA pseudouridine2605 synthase
VGGIDGMRAESVKLLKRSQRETHLTIDLTEGQNREIRRLLKAVGHEVTRLLRVSFGTIQLGTLQPGKWREVSREEIARACDDVDRLELPDRRRTARRMVAR